MTERIEHDFIDEHGRHWTGWQYPALGRIDLSGYPTRMLPQCLGALFDDVVVGRRKD